MELSVSICDLNPAFIKIREQKFVYEHFAESISIFLYAYDKVDIYEGFRKQSSNLRYVSSKAQAHTNNTERQKI